MRTAMSTRFGSWGLLLGLGGVVFAGEVRAQEPVPAQRSAVRHAIVSPQSPSAQPARYSGVSRADGWRYAENTPGYPIESYTNPQDCDGLGSYGGSVRYRGSYPTGTRDSYYSLSNYGAGGYGLGGYGLGRYGLGTYGQSTLGWGHFGSYATFNGYAGYAESSSYGY